MSARRAAIPIDGQTLTLEHVESVADGAPARLAPGVLARVRRSRSVVERALRSGEQVYGVNTGFGQLSQVRIHQDRLDELQLNLIRSHAAGVGAPLPEPTVRAILALRANCLCRGHSGLTPATLKRMIEMLDARIHPVVPEQGSVGASGDLAPLAHIALSIAGEGEVFYRGERMPAAAALKQRRMAPIRLGAKEGLALINGTQVMSAIGIRALLKAERLARAADIVGAMSLDALQGSHSVLAPAIHAARPQRGQKRSAANLRRILKQSEIERAHADCGRIQDSYSLRCIPQVHGAVRDALAHVRSILEIEVNSSTDNPMVFIESGRIVSGGNFHGQPISLALDQLGIAVCSLATISERRIDRLLNAELSGLPAFLAHDPGLHSGFMLAHVTAAALVSENKVLAHPASVDSIPTSAGKEDHVAMGAHAARQASKIVDHVALVLGIEAICAAQALDMRSPLKAGRGAEAARRALRRKIRHLHGDRRLDVDIESAAALVSGDALRLAAEADCGPLA